MIYTVKFTKRFMQDLKIANKQGKNIDLLFSVVDKLANKQQLPTKFYDHELKGNYRGLRECHIEPDWLLIYEYRDDVLVLMLNRINSHSNLFKR